MTTTPTARAGLRVLQVAPYAPNAWAYGGIPRVVGALARGLAERGHEVTIVATDAGDERSRLTAGRLDFSREARFAPDGDGVDHRLFRNLSNRLAYHLQFFTPVGMRRFLAANAGRFDVAHLHAHRNLPVTFAAAALERAGVPFLFTPNGTAPRIERRRLAKWAYDSFLGRRSLDRAARVLAVSAVEEGELNGLGVERGRIARLPNPIVLDEFDDPPERGAFRRRLGIGSECVVLYLGRFSPRKRLDTLVEAFARLGDPPARLVLAGSDMGTLDQVTPVARRLGIGERLHTPGLLSGRERLEALVDADVVAYATEREIFGLVPFEALLCGAPVVVGSDSGCGEWVGETGGGLVVPPGDAAALAAAIRTLLAEPDVWRRRARDGAGAVRRLFGHDAVAERLETLYRESVDGVSGARPAAPSRPAK